MRSDNLGRSLGLHHNLIKQNILSKMSIVKSYLEFLIRQLPVSVLVREVEHFLDVHLRDGDGQTPHDVLEVALGDEVFV